MGRFADLARRLNPVNGVITTDTGEPFDRAEWGLFRQIYDLQWQTVRNGTSRFSGRRRGIDQEVYWIGLDIPVGRKLVLWVDNITLTEGDYDVDIFDAPDGFTGGTNGVKRCLCGSPGTVQTDIVFGVTPADEATHTQRLQSFIDVGNVPGTGRPTVSPVSDDAFQILFVPTVIRITRVSVDAYTVGYSAVAGEEDA